MAKHDDSAEPYQSPQQAGLPPSYGLGIQQGMYGGANSGNFMQGAGQGGGMNQGGMGSSSPSLQLMQMLMQMYGGGQQRMNNGMGGPMGTGFNFSTPISSPNLFSGLSSNNQTTPAGQALGWRTNFNSQTAPKSLG